MRQGEAIACENGHLICEVARDVDQSEPFVAEDMFTAWQVREPKLGDAFDTLEPCRVCGVRWIKLGRLIEGPFELMPGGPKMAVTQGPFLHFADGGYRHDPQARVA